MKRASTGWPGNLGLKKPRIAGNTIRCLTGYQQKGLRITERKGSHEAICCPAELIEQARQNRGPLDPSLVP